MSLDVYLINKHEESCPHCSKPIAVREEDVYSGNITHNLGKMAEAAGIYEAMWCPEDISSKPRAKDIIVLLEKGLSDLKSRPEYFEQFNATNGWGLYEHFVPFVEEYLEACKEYPEAEISASR